MQTTTRINTPVLTEIAQPSNLTVSNLSDIEHVVNNKSLSGKRAGMSCMIDGSIYVASDSNPSSPWNILGGGYNVEGSFSSEVLQAGLLDTPSSITFGAGGITTNGYVEATASGDILILKPGYYAFKQRFRAKRAGASGVSDIFFWAEISLDNGITWEVIGTSVDIALDNSNETTIFFDIALGFFPEGVRLRNRFARSSTGDNSGDLIVGVPSSALASLGVPTAPSAQVTIYHTHG